MGVGQTEWAAFSQSAAKGQRLARVTWAGCKGGARGGMQARPAGNRLDATPALAISGESRSGLWKTN